MLKMERIYHYFFSKNKGNNLIICIKLTDFLIGLEIDKVCEKYRSLDTAPSDSYDLFLETLQSIDSNKVFWCNVKICQIILNL